MTSLLLYAEKILILLLHFDLETGSDEGTSIITSKFSAVIHLLADLLTMGVCAVVFNLHLLLFFFWCLHVCMPLF